MIKSWPINEIPINERQGSLLDPVLKNKMKLVWRIKRRTTATAGTIFERFTFVPNGVPRRTEFFPLNATGIYISLEKREFSSSAGALPGRFGISRGVILVRKKK